MKLVTQHPYPRACVLACLAMACDTTLAEVIKIAGTSDAPDLSIRLKVFKAFGLVYPPDKLIVESFGPNTIANLTQAHPTLICSVFSYIDSSFAHSVVLHHRDLYDPFHGLNPLWPWRYYIATAAPLPTR